MSRESIFDLNRNTLVGFATARGFAWHYDAAAQGAESNHYPNDIPAADVERRIFNWTVESYPMTFTTDDGTVHPILDKQVWVRSDNKYVLGTPGADAAIHEYRDVLLTRVLAIVQESRGDLAIGSAGLLESGRRAWLSIEMPENVTTKEGVDFRPRLLAASSHDGKLATTYKLVNGIVVCDNTLAMALGESGGAFKVKHTRRSEIKLATAREALGLLVADADALTAEIKALCETAVTDTQWSAFVKELTPLNADASKRATTLAEKKRDELTTLWNSDERVTPWKGTGWGAVMAANTWDMHMKPTRGDTDRGERSIMDALTDKRATDDAAILATLNRVLTGELVSA